MNTYDTIFREYAKKWKIETQTARVIFLIVDMCQSYSKTCKSLDDLGFKVSQRKLRYFYNKVILTQRYGLPESVGKLNYRKNVIKKS